MNRPKYELADVINTFLTQLSQIQGISNWQFYILNTLLQCRTASLGGHEEVCATCGNITYSYNSCRNRHCPKCQGTDREKWTDARKADLLPVKYFHVVFTVPDALHSLFLFHREEMFNLLFKTSWDVLKSFGCDPKWLGGQIGATSILHTWTQKLLFHPHIHFIVPAGGIIAGKSWKNTRSNGDFLFPVEMLSNVFRARFMAALKLWAVQNSIVLRKTFRDKLFLNNWVVYAKEPFAGPDQVIEYLGRYTHRVAISNNRIKKITKTHVTFSYIDRNDNNTKKEITLRGPDFLKRFILHILPHGYTRIRHFGFLSSRNKVKALALIRNLLNVPAPLKKIRNWVEIAMGRWGIDPFKCRLCGGTKIILGTIPRQRAPPLTLTKNYHMALQIFEQNC